MAKANLDSSKEYPTCFVCGCHKTGAHSLSIRQSVTPGAYFPFLETHEPPDGAELPTADGKVLSCFACYAFLIQQWDSYEKNKVPLIKRIYWLKRIDNGPYTGVEMGMQSEYASQVFGLTSEYPGSVETKKQTLNTGTSFAKSLTAISQQTFLEEGPCVSSEMQNKNTYVDSHSSPFNSVPIIVNDGTQQEALDLSLDKQKRKLVDDGNCGPEKVKIKLAPLDKSNQQVLDLSMPDKNAITEVCYICGSHFTKGTLSDVFAKAINNFTPFFPSLMLHPRPSGSRPMESSGKVLGCKDCLSFLISQWQLFEEQKIPLKKRSYYLIKQSVDAEKFICCRCNQFCSTGSLHLLSFRGKKFFTQTESGISSSEHNGQIRTCENCYKIIENDSFSGIGLGSQDEESSLNLKNSLPILSRQSSHNSELGIDAVTVCCLCHQSFALKHMQTLSMAPDPTNSTNMFFSFLKFLPQISQNMITEDGRILACKACYYHLSLQWAEYERDNVPQDQRHFSLRTLIVASHSPRLTPGPNHTPSHSSSLSSNTPSETSTPPSCTIIGSQLSFIENNSKEELKRKVFCKTEGYHGQPLKELEVVAATPNPNTIPLPAITTQRALNININCYICGFHSKAGQTYAVSSKNLGKEVFFPFLAKHVSAHPEAVADENTYLVCLICFHSLVIQWQHYEKNRIEYHSRFYDTYNFTCFICSTRTYRKRLYLLPVKDFPYLKDHICPPGGMVVNNGHSVVVCKDCFVSMNEQFAESEKWGVPVEKRQYNWIKRPPPPDFPQTPAEIIKSKVNVFENKIQSNVIPLYQSSSSLETNITKGQFSGARGCSQVDEDDKNSKEDTFAQRFTDSQKLDLSLVSKETKLLPKVKDDEKNADFNPLENANNLFNYR